MVSTGRILADIFVRGVVIPSLLFAADCYGIRKNGDCLNAHFFAVWISSFYSGVAFFKEENSSAWDILL